MMEKNGEEPGSKYSVVAMETLEKLQRICSNVIGYCRTVMESAGTNFTFWNEFISTTWLYMWECDLTPVSTSRRLIIPTCGRFLSSRVTDWGGKKLLVVLYLRLLYIALTTTITLCNLCGLWQYLTVFMDLYSICDVGPVNKVRFFSRFSSLSLSCAVFTEFDRFFISRFSPY